ncbi:MAG: type I asparaginase [Thaumarchaeota archaeon]|nr:type I asparaginase [Nitrososphaerota archaeon]
MTTSRQVHILTTGGTIMSRSGPDSSGNADVASVEEIFPEVNVEGVEYEVKEVLSKGSANMVDGDWIKIASAVESSIRSNADGIVILHGTDTMQYTAAALSFMISGLRIPVVLTGSMIPMGDQGTDGIGNLKAAIRVAAFADLAEVCVLFSADMSEDHKIIIRGTRAKKIHSYDKQAFASVNFDPLGHSSCDEIKLEDWRVKRSNDRRLKVRSSLNANVCLIKTHPALTNKQVTHFLTGYEGAVIEGTGIGHVRVDDGLLTAISSFGKPAVLTTQCLYGGERLGTYAMDKKILLISNIIPVRDMLPEVALVKLMWCLAQEESVKELMLKNVAGEIAHTA